MVVVVTFIVRIFFPIGDWIPVLGIQPAHLPQYVCCFVLGVIASQNDILEKLSYKSSVRWFLAGQFLVLLVFPAIFIIGGGAENVDLFMGGVTLQSFIFTLWEQSVAVCLIIGLLGIFKRYGNWQTGILQDLSQNSYAIYIIHSLPLVVVSVLVHSMEIDSMILFLTLAVPVLFVTYLLAKLGRFIPFVKRIV